MRPDAFKVCSTCKTPIAFGSTYYVCSVSTCNRARSGLVFCSVDCWEAHVPVMRHRDAGAVEERAPSREAWMGQQAEQARGRDDERSASTAGAQASAGTVRRRIAVASPGPAPAPPKEILVVASKLKAYIRQRYGMNTSDAVLEVLSDALRRLADEAVLRARTEGRKTVLDRDFESPDTARP